jgi:ABC-2 type transport system permease protein
VIPYARFETLRTLRNPGFLFLVTVVPAALYVIGVRAVNEGDSISGISASLWYLASAGAIGAIGAAITGSGARLAAERVSGWSRQLHVTPLTEAGWLVGRVLASVLVVTPVVVVVGIIAVVIEDVSLSAAQWLGLAAALTFGSVPIALIGLIVGLAFRFEAAQAAQAVAFVLLAFLGGAFAQSDDPPAALEAIVQLSPSYYLVELARYAVGAEASVAVSIAALAVSTIVLTAVVVAIRRRTV